MKALIALLLLLSVLQGKGQQLPEPDPDLPWQEDREFWKKLLNNPLYREYYKEKNAEEMIRKAWEYALENGIRQENMDAVLEELAEEITDDLLDSFEEEVLEQLLEEVGVARYLDKVYEQVLKAALPRPGGIPMLDVGMEPAIKKGKTPHNLKSMLRLAVEKWVNQQWKKQVAGIYGLQRDELEYQKKVGMVALLKMAALDYEHFLSLEIMVPEEVLNYAVQVRQIYRSAEESLLKGKALYTELNTLTTGMEIPRKLEQLEALEASNREAKTTSWELINQRRKILALAYLQLAERAREKGEDLRQSIQQEGHLKMSHGERLKALQLVNAYLEDHFRYKEKADELLRASLENKGTAQKEASLAPYRQQLRLKNMAQ